MGKQRLDCPNCGKTVAVSDTAKKARCPGCKDVIDVASALEGGADPGGEAAPLPETDQGTTEGSGAAAEAEAPEKPSVAEGTEEDAEPEGGEQEEGEVEVAATAEHWMFVAGGAVVLFIALLFFVKWYVAIAIASALGLYVDASLARITRVSPSGKGTSVGPMIWGLVGFVPFVGVGVYALLRRKLVANSPDDIAPPGMDRDDMEYEGKVHAPSLASPGVLLIIPIVVVAVMLFARQPSLVLARGTVTKTGRVLTTDSVWFNLGKVGFVLKGKSSLSGYGGKLGYAVVKLENDSETATNVAGDVDVSSGRTLSSWTVTVSEAGSYRIEVKREDGRTLAETHFKIRPQ